MEIKVIHVSNGHVVVDAGEPARAEACDARASDDHVKVRHDYSLGGERSRRPIYVNGEGGRGDADVQGKGDAVDQRPSGNPRACACCWMMPPIARCMFAYAASSARDGARKMNSNTPTVARFMSASQAGDDGRTRCDAPPENKEVPKVVGSHI